MGWSKCTKRCYKCKKNSCMYSKDHKEVCSCGKPACKTYDAIVTI